MKKNGKRIAGVFLACLLLFVVFSGSGLRGEQVRLEPLKKETVVEIIAVTGTVHGSTESLISAEITAPLTEIFVREGQTVEKGQELFRLSDTVLQAQVQQAQASLQVAQARYRQASRPALESEHQRVEASTLQALRTAEADHQAQLQELERLRSGTRPEQLEQVQAELERSQSEHFYSQKDYKRQRALFEDGVISKSQLEKAESQKIVTLRNFERSRARLEELGNGPTSEELRIAEARLLRAEASVQGAKDKRAAELLGLKENPRTEDVDLAAAQIEEASSSRSVAEARLSQARVKAPFAGVVTEIKLDPGDVASPKVPVLELVSLAQLEVRAEVESSQAKHLFVGQDVEVQTEGGQSQPLVAKIAGVSSRHDSQKGTVEFRVLLPGKSPLRPGQNVDLNIVREQAQEKLMLPTVAARSAGPRMTVYLVKDGKIRHRQIQVGALTPGGYPVQSGLRDEERVVVSPGRFADGKKVRAIFHDEV